MILRLAARLREEVLRAAVWTGLRDPYPLSLRTYLSRRRMMIAIASVGALCLLAVWWEDGRMTRRIHEAVSRLQPSAIEEQIRFREEIRRNEAIDKALLAVLDQTDADRAFVALAHNGKTDLSQAIPFLFFSVTQMSLREGVAFQEAWARPMPIGSFGTALRKMFADPLNLACLWRDRGDTDISAVGRAFMEARGAEVAVVCPLYGWKSDPTKGTPRLSVLGLFWIEVLRRETLGSDRDLVIRQVREASLAIYDLLTEGR